MQSYRIGRLFLESIPVDSDLIDYIQRLCLNQSIQTARFNIVGMVGSAMIGVYDRTQQVYVTHLEKRATEVISCGGHVTWNEDNPQVAAKIILADHHGQVTGGHLFSPTLVQFAEIDLQELIEINNEGGYDANNRHAGPNPQTQTRRDQARLRNHIHRSHVQHGLQR